MYFECDNFKLKEPHCALNCCDNGNMKNGTDFGDKKSGKFYGQGNTENEAEVGAKRNGLNGKYFFKQTFVNEYDAFNKYFDAIKQNGVMLDIVQDVENMGDFCDLFDVVNKDYNDNPLNLYSDPIPLDEENDSILHASKLIRAEIHPEKGRCLIANTVIPRNKILIFEPPVVLQVKPLCTCIANKESLYRCHNCGVACKMFFTCDGCNVCIFCSRVCMVDAYKNYHRYECYGFQRHFWSMEDTDYSYLSLRMVLYGASKNFKTDPIDTRRYGSADNSYPFVYMLETNFKKLSLPKINEILYSSARNLIYLIQKTNFFTTFRDKRVNLYDLYLYVGGLLVRHYCQAQANNVILKYPNLPAGFGINVDGGSGKAICPTISLLNHSCSPNAAIVVYYDSVSVKSLKRIEAGEEVTICYSEVHALLTVPDRQTITEEILYFTCKCYFCEYERNWELVPYKCKLCNVGKSKKIDLDIGISAGYCTRCQKVFDFDEVIENLKISNICQNLYKATYATEHVTRLAECYTNIYPSNSWKLLDIYYLLYEKHVLGEDKPLEALKYGLLSFSILEHYISRVYLPILTAKVRFVSTILNMKRFSETKQVTASEFDTMRIFVSELIKMKDDLEFYLPEKRIFFHQDVMIKVHEIFKAMRVN